MALKKSDLYSSLLLDIGSSSPAVVQDQRRRRAKLVQYSLLLAVGALIATSVQNMFWFQPEVANRFNQWAIVLGANILLFYVWAKSPSYPKLRWVDVLVALPFIPIMDQLRRVVTSQVMLIGFTPPTILMGNAVLAVFFVSIFFAGNSAGFAIWCAFHIVGYALAFSEMRPTIEVVGQVTSVYLPVLVISVYSNWAIEREGRNNFALRQELATAKAKSEELLYNVLPEEVAERLRRGEAVADAYSDATIVFVDLVGSSALARSLSPRHFIALLNEVFSLADQFAERRGIEKVKTIGDAYLAIAGARGGGNALAAVSFAQEVAASIGVLAANKRLELGVRIGIHSGPVVGGIIGAKRATYDYWGDTMNVAARVQSAAKVGGVAVTEPTYYATRDQMPYAAPRLVMLKGIGEVKVFDLV
jgi:class 3 adenylate cyclase